MEENITVETLVALLANETVDRMTAEEELVNAVEHANFNEAAYDGLIYQLDTTKSVSDALKDDLKDYFANNDKVKKYLGQYLRKKSKEADMPVVSKGCGKTRRDSYLQIIIDDLKEKLDSDPSFLTKHRKNLVIIDKNITNKAKKLIDDLMGGFRNG